MVDFSLHNSLIIITGAAGLLGRQHAHAVVEGGADVVLLDIDKHGLQSLSEELGGQTNIMHHVVDITDESAVQKVRQWLVKTAGDGQRLGLINNAAIDAKVDNGCGQNFSRLENFLQEQWQREIDVGLTGAMLCAKHFGSLMANRGQGVILNIASDLAVIAPSQFLYRQEHLAEELQSVKPVTYSVIKHGLIGLTKYLATYWPQQGVRCNALAPGGIENGQPQEFIDRLTPLIPQGRMAKPDEYRGAVQFLLSNASSYMNGQVLTMDGGRTIW